MLGAIESKSSRYQAALVMLRKEMLDKVYICNSDSFDYVAEVASCLLSDFDIRCVRRYHKKGFIRITFTDYLYFDFYVKFVGYAGGVHVSGIY